MTELFKLLKMNQIKKIMMILKIDKNILKIEKNILKIFITKVMKEI